MNGGRLKWLEESDKPLTNERPQFKPVEYRVKQTHPEVRAMLNDVLEVIRSRQTELVDVRSPDEFFGKLIAPPAAMLLGILVHAAHLLAACRPTIEKQELEIENLRFAAISLGRALAIARGALAGL
jgi:3-mercaptopyruvate sulfurtransferase SseA